MLKRSRKKLALISHDRTFSVVIHRAAADETGYWAEVFGLLGCVTQGETLDETITHAREAIQGHLEALAKLGQPMPHGDPPAIVPVTVQIPQHA